MSYKTLVSTFLGGRVTVWRVQYADRVFFAVYDGEMLVETLTKRSSANYFAYYYSLRA